MPKITSPQLKKLQVLYGQLVKRDLSLDASKETRLVWAGDLLGHPVKSFSDLSSDEARRLINTACARLGLAFPAPAPYSQDAARRRGLEGRRDDQEFASTPQLVSAKQLAEISRLYGELGMDQTRFEAFVAARSPFGKGKKVIRTGAEANKVRFALLGMIRRKHPEKRFA